jgi:thymidine phosphorylase
VRALGGPADLVERPLQYLPMAPVELPVCPDHRGYLTAMDVRAIGMAIVAMGGGRRRADDVIDPGVGLSQMRGLGAELGPDTPLCLVHARDAAQARACADAILAAIELGESAPERQPVIQAHVGGRVG